MTYDEMPLAACSLSEIEQGKLLVLIDGLVRLPGSARRSDDQAAPATRRDSSCASPEHLGSIVRQIQLNLMFAFLTPGALMNTERSFAALRTFSDAHIEHWAAIYQQPDLNRVLRGRRVCFETFLLAPEAILAAIGRPTIIVSRCGLLPAQRQARMKADLESALIALARCAIEQLERERACCRNGRFVEKLRHRAWPRHADKRLTVDA